MAVQAGTRLGPYEVLEPLGAGGMGEVYRARDPRLEREVAIKVLRSEGASNPERLRRFERETKAVASLNHPHILTVYDVGTHDGTPYVVTELLEGETLRGLVARRAPTVPQIVGYMLQAARGLEAAHAKGIVHRDLKPENLFLTTDGRVKVLDFGLAKLVRPEGEAGSSLSTAVESTSAGRVRGTVLYMSPEQARGLPVDARSDVFSFGVVLHELLAGKHPFRRDTVAATLTAIVEDRPSDLEILGRGVPPVVGRIVRRCLEKTREDRYASGHDVVVALEAVLAVPRGAETLREVEERSPYPGLGSFEERDAGVFFGRERETEEVWRRIRKRRLFAVIGPSGVGKTSFVRAGVCARRPDGWAVALSTPGRVPLRALARALAPQVAGDAEAVDRLLGFDDPEVAFATLAQWRRGHGEALLVVDQFEELFTLNPPEVQDQFSTLLGRLATEADVHVLLSLRDDFLMRCHDLEPLAPVFSELVPLGALKKEGLEHALVEPARSRGYAFEDGTLVEEMVSVVEGQRGALPLLAFAVARLWERRDQEAKRLTRAAYEEMGGVEGALAQHAEATVEGIGAAHQGLVRDIFRNLVTAQGTRAVVDRADLLSAFPERETAERVLTRLVDARLLTSYETTELAPSSRGASLGAGDEAKRRVRGRDDARAGSLAADRTVHRVEVVHESLLSAWPRLVRWQAQDADGARLRDELRQAAQLWEERGRPDDLLWTGTSYREFALWRERDRSGLPSTEAAFAVATEAHATRRRRRRRTVAAILVVAATAVAAVTSVLWQRSNVALRKAEAEVRQREAAQILSLGRLRLEGHPTAALAHALASLERFENEPARRLAVQALWKGPMVHVVADATNPVASAWSPDGRWLAVGGPGGLLLLDRDTGETRRLEAGGLASPVGFSSDGSRLVSQRSDALVLWSVPELERLDTWTLPWAGEGRTSWWAALFAGRVLTFEIDPSRRADQAALVRERSLAGGAERVLGRGPDGDVDLQGRWLVSMEGDRLVRGTLAALDAPPRVLARHRKALAWMAPWTDRIATADASGEIRIWNAETGRLLRTLRSPADARRLALDPSGRYVAAAPAGGALAPRSFFVFDLRAPADADPIALLHDEIAWLNDRTFHPEGVLLASGNYPDGVLLWNLATRRSLVLRGQKAGLVAVAFTPEGRLVSTSEEGVVRLWPLWTDVNARVQELRSRPGREKLGALLEIPPSGRFAVVYDRTGGQLLTLPLDGSAGRTLRWEGELGDLDLASDGRRLAASFFAWDRPEAASLQVIDLETGERIHLSLDRKTEACVVNSPSLGAIQVPQWLPDGRLVSEGTLGLRLWNLADGTSRLLRPCRESKSFPPILAAAPDGVLTLFDPSPGPGETSTLVAYDLTTDESHEITWHGNRISSLALDPTGSVLVTGDADGLVRVGPLAGGEPHLLYGHTQLVSSVAVSPDGRWIASASDDETIRLWPMPDLSGPPLHTLPYEELLARLRAFTNLRVAPDPDSATGYRLDLGPFRGWKEIPEW